MKTSEIFEGENSSLKQAFENSVHNPCPFGNDDCPKCKTTTMRERFDEEFPFGSFAGSSVRANEVLDFIEQELKKERELKDQEHKAELEMIKGEIEDMINMKKLLRNSGWSGEIDMDIVALQGIIPILDSHINKQNL
jgi:hypothetical protein